jgi:hypothetical protein
MKTTIKICLVFMLFTQVAFSQDYLPTITTGTTKTMQGFGLFGSMNGYKDRGNFSRDRLERSGSYGKIAYFQSVSNPVTSQVGLGLVSDYLQTLKGNRKTIVAFFENGNITIRGRKADNGQMLSLASVGGVPVGAWLKCQKTGSDVAFFYSVSPQNSTNPNWVLIGNFVNFVQGWTMTKQAFAVGSPYSTPETAIITNIQDFTIGSVYALSGITIAPMASNATRFQITATQLNKPVGNVNYQLVIRDAYNNIVYNDANILTDTDSYPTIDFTPSYANYTPHVTAAGTYTVSLTANGSTQSQNITFTNVQLGISGGGTQVAAGTFLNNVVWTAPTATVAAQIKYIGCEAGTIANNGTRTIDLILSSTPDPNQHKITVVRGSNGTTNNINVLLINGILLTGNDFFVRTGDIHQLQWVYSNQNPPIENIWWNEYSNTNTAILTFNVTKN